jgi:pilus assembly protein CpaE
MNAIVESASRPAAAEQETRRADRPRLAAYVRDRATENVLREALGDLLPAEDAIRRSDLAATRKALQREPAPGVLILDVSGEANPLLVLDDMAQFVEPGVRVLVIGDSNDMAFYRQVTRTLGVLEYLHRPLNREMVARHFRPLIIGQDPAGLQIRAGRIVSVTGVRGGVGATTIAANVAAHLAEVTRRHTLLLDADLHGGTAALMLSAETGDALRTALEHPDRVDEVFLQRGARSISDRLDVLCAEESLDRTRAIAPESAAELLELLRRHYSFIIIDVPRYATPFNRVFLDAAHQRVLVMDGSLASVRDALRFLALPATPAQSRPPVVVLNHVGHPGMLSRKQVIEALGQAPEVTIPYLPKTLGRAATIGQPASRARRGALPEAVARLAQEITVSASIQRKTEGRGLLTRLLRR